ncbi:nucleotidyltransferase domain-containing protein [Chitinophaga agrisoli]|uniref:Nucleotidyltransferase domain-containing protein n=1 Tax=Chitinophaga agrisoli TaxID=2607653 RepID=A0A5B2VZE4_9BACT|nr:nucleotidyltransferase domain-containing protein [Chitinophaga agrisoli]KAA2244831.1 nucleotidyltransferase domain-containing protein [Chitinophaga agrisoli]
MQTIILNKLKQIAAANRIQLLYACESGSRGWGFPSPDSDYDVRFIYIRPLNHYLAVQESQYQLSFPINDELDIYGWDLRKVLQLMRKSNTTPFEWLQSPVIYDQRPGFREDLWALCPHFFSQRSNMHHYLGIAQGAMDTMQGDEIRIKKLFYVLRPLLAAKWCLERNSIAPMEMAPLMVLLPYSLRQQVQELIDFKATAAEGYMIRLAADLRSFIAQEFASISAASASLPRNEFETERLDAFFIKTLQEYNDNSRNETERLAAAGMCER